MRQSERSQRGTSPSHGTSTSRVGPGRCSNQQKPPCDLPGPDIGSAGGGVKGFFGRQRQKSARTTSAGSRVFAPWRGYHAPTSHHSAGWSPPAQSHVPHAITFVLHTEHKSWLPSQEVEWGWDGTSRIGT